MIKRTERIIKDGVEYEVVKVIGKSKSKEEIEFEQWSSKSYCLEAVKQDGDSLRYVKEQSEAICLEAVKRNGYSLKYVKVKAVFLKLLELKKGE